MRFRTTSVVGRRLEVGALQKTGEVSGEDFFSDLSTTASTEESSEVGVQNVKLLPFRQNRRRGRSRGDLIRVQDSHPRASLTAFLTELVWQHDQCKL